MRKGDWWQLTWFVGGAALAALAPILVGLILFIALGACCLAAMLRQ
jgi:hypothetical protein